MVGKQFFPMMPETSWWSLRQQFKKTIPSLLSVSYLKSLLGLTSDQSARNLLSPLKQMKIIDEDGKPLQRANDWRNDDKYLAVCQEILEEIYPPELLELFPDREVDSASVKNWFMNALAVGASAASKNAATFTMLKSGEIKDLAAIKTQNTKPKSKTTQPFKSREEQTKKLATMTGESDSIPVAMNPAKGSGLNIGTNEIVPTVHIDLQIHISPEASSNQIDAIFASMAKHLYGRG